MSGNLHRRLSAVETAERAKRVTPPELRDMSGYTDDELRLLVEYAQRLVDGEQVDFESLAAEFLELSTPFSNKSNLARARGPFSTTNERQFKA